MGLSSNPLVHVPSFDEHGCSMPDYFLPFLFSPFFLIHASIFTISSARFSIFWLFFLGSILSSFLKYSASGKPPVGFWSSVNCNHLMALSRSFSGLLSASADDAASPDASSFFESIPFFLKNFIAFAISTARSWSDCPRRLGSMASNFLKYSPSDLSTSLPLFRYRNAFSESLSAMIFDKFAVTVSHLFFAGTFFSAPPPPVEASRIPGSCPFALPRLVVLPLAVAVVVSFFGVDVFRTQHNAFTISLALCCKVCPCLFGSMLSSFVK
mmetsp:Transcript_21560/g.60016  ORF Transcript_21560/g.60016 Transcript_21560/m.60016 type:complete len:268 (+) Transcript_21560:138-941(+)